MTAKAKQQKAASKPPRLALTSETIKDLPVSSKSRPVQGGVRGENRPEANYRSCVC
jgi:hypothetical protein